MPVPVARVHGAKCPVCQNDVVVILEYGEKRTWDYPGSSPHIVDVEGCECREFVDGLFRKRVHQVDEHNAQPLNIPEYIRVDYDDLLYQDNAHNFKDYVV